ncbi:MAG: MMPL family transporter, partial [Solirubrobacteraceae bacterium]|nr:MMPL family transporter [Solirubrobacteraceae bacterium]
MVPRVLAAVMGLAVRRPAAVAGAVLALAAAAGLLALRLEPSTGLDTLVGRATPGHAATQTLHRRFGDDAVYVLVRESAARVALTDDLGRVLGLEGCLSGNVPQGVAPPGGARGPCARLARSRSVKVVFGPGTFLNEAVGQISDQLRAAAAGQTREAASAGRAAYRRALRAGLGDRQARVARRQAREAVAARFYQELLALALRYGLTSAPSLDDPRFVARVVFDDRKPAGTPKARLASIFPGRDGALIHVRLRHGLSEARRRAAIADVRAATRMPQWRLSRGDYAVTGAPVVLEELSASLGSSIAVLLAVALIVMALTLPMVFRARLRLLPLLVALAATAMTFGVTALAGVPLTMASIAVIPVLIGLAVDYAIQIQSRIQESGPPLSRAARQVARRGAPTIAVAGAATAAGFLVLVLSPVPMVRGFGVLLVVGIALALGCALTLGIAAQALADKRSVRAREREGDATASMPGAAPRGARARTAALRPAGALGAATRRGAGRGYANLVAT